MTLTEFLLARIAEDERRARDVWRVRPDIPGSLTVQSQLDGGDLVKVNGDVMTLDEMHELYYVRAEPDDRKLLAVESKRQIIAAVREWFADQGGDDPAGILRALALSYRDHPDYREEWRQ